MVNLDFLFCRDGDGDGDGEENELFRGWRINQSGASSETPVAPKNLRKGTDWAGIFVKAITSASDSDEVRTLAARGLLFFEAYLRPGVRSEIRKILRQEESCGGGYAKSISSGAPSETPRFPKHLSNDAVWVDLIVKEILSF
ncbi:hypothetical protein V2J09_006608 [Rumex salicifolius]